MKVVASLIAAVVVVGGLSGCTSAPCGSGAPSGEAAVAGLIDAARAADGPADVCAFVSPGYAVSADDLDELRSTFVDHPEDELAYELFGQMGSTAEVRVSDGAFSREFHVTADSDTRWTVAFGTLFGSE